MEDDGVGATPSSAAGQVQADNAGVMAQSVLITQQTVNMGGKPEWIQNMTLDQLEIARERLYRASRRHENMTVVPVVVPIAVFLMIIALAVAGANHYHQPIRANGDRAVIAFLAGICAVPFWAGTYDIRRRHRQVMLAAERRWAEVVVEIALRKDPPAPPDRSGALLKWLKRPAR